MTVDDEFTAALLAVADDPAGLDRLVELAESGDVEAVADAEGEPTDAG